MAIPMLLRWFLCIENGHWLCLFLFSELGPVSLTVFHRNSNSMEISFNSHLHSNTVIATKCCTWHDSCAVVTCAKICCNLMASNRITARRSFHRIWIVGKKSLVKRAPGLNLYHVIGKPSYYGDIDRCHEHFLTEKYSCLSLFIFITNIVTLGEQMHCHGKLYWL